MALTKVTGEVIQSSTSINANIAGNVTGDVTSTGISTFSGGVQLGTGTTISSPTSNEFTVSTNGSERVRVDSVGCVGIGTDDPIVYTASSKTLHIHGGSNPSEVRLTTSSSGVSQGSAGAIIQFNGTSLAVWNAENDNIRFGTNNIERLLVDASGRVTMPYQPSTCRRVTAGTVIGDQLIPWDTAILSSSDISYNTTTRRFTVSISGKYEITFSGFKTPSGAARVMLGVNTDAPTAASNYGHTYTGGTNYDSINFCVILNLSANDYFTFRVSEGTLYSQPSDQFNFMTAFLIG